jgi:HK97 family phage major capsid protein
MSCHNPQRSRAGIVSVRADASANAMLDELNRRFQAFKDEHTAELAGIRKDVVQSEKVERINAAIGDLQAAIDEMARRQAVAGLGAPAPRPGDDPAYRAAFTQWFKSGDDEAKLKSMALPRAAIVGTPADGGFLAPVEWDRTIIEKLKIISPMRQICNVTTISMGSFSKVYSDRNTASGWVGEVAARPVTGNAQLSTLTFPIGEIYANPQASQQLLDDALVDIEQWLSNEVETEFAAQEGVAFVTGNGTNRPKGIMTNVAGDNHPLGAVPVVNSGSAAALTADGLLNLTYALPSAFTGNASFIMNRATQGAVRLFKDTTGQYLWQPPVTAGQPASLFGYPVIEIPALAAIAANALPVAFGDFQRAYRIIDRVGIRVLRDPYTAKPYVLFYTTKRVGGQIENTEALRYHRVAV